MSRIDVSGATFVRLLALVAAVWLWLRLWQWILLFIVAVVIAVALEPVVERLEQRRVRRVVGAPLMVLLLAIAVGAFVYFAGASLVEQGRFLSARYAQVQQEIARRVPATILNLLPRPEGLDPRLSTYASRAGSAALTGIVLFAGALVITVYLLLEGRRIYLWMAAFAPAPYRPRVHKTAQHAQRIIRAYVRGNVATSVFAGLSTAIVLSVLQVPAALLLAVLAFIFDFVPVVGFFLSATPAVFLAFTVSIWVGVGVMIFYLSYHVVENYYIAPKVYGKELRLSDLAVIAAFVVGAELGGVLGALLALPIAALYPVVEEIWLADVLGEDVAAAHRRIERGQGGEKRQLQD